MLEWAFSGSITECRLQFWVAVIPVVVKKETETLFLLQAMNTNRICISYQTPREHVQATLPASSVLI